MSNKIPDGATHYKHIIGKMSEFDAYFKVDRDVIQIYFKGSMEWVVDKYHRLSELSPIGELNDH